MGASRALIIGSDKDYCYVIKEFLESKGLIVSLVLDYNQGIDKLFFENPDITVLELISSSKISTYLLGKVRSSPDLNIFDNFNNTDMVPEPERKPVLILEETNQLNTLLAYLNTYLLNDFQQSRQVKLAQDTSRSTDLKSYPYPILLSYIYKTKISCVLDINSKFKLKVFCEKGLPVFTEAGAVETALGRMLVDKGIIKNTVNLEEIMEIANERGQKFGEVLVSLGHISPHDLSNILQLQIIEKLIRGFELKEGDFNLKPQDDIPSDIVRYDVHFSHIMQEGIKRYINMDLLKYVFYDGDTLRKVLLDNAIHELSQNIGLGPKDLRVIQDLEKYNDLEHLLKNSSVDRDKVLRLLFLIYLIGILKIENDPYATIHQIFSSILESKVDDEQYELQEIINLEDEISDSVKNGKPFAKKQDTIINKRIITKSALEDELLVDTDNIESVTKESNAISFKNHKNIKEDLEISQSQDVKLIKEDDNEQSTKRLKPDKEDLINSFNEVSMNLEEKSHYDILGLANDSSEEEIRDAYYRLVKKYHPDKLYSIDKTTRESADRLFARITVAYHTLIDKDQRSQYDASFELEELKSQAGILYKADVEYNEGLALLKQKQYDQAIERFNKAKGIKPENVKCESLIAWANYLKDRDNVDNINKSISILEKSITQDSSNPDTYYYLGIIYKHLNELRKAEINFSKAVEHDPDYVDAKRELRVVKNRITERKNLKNLKTDKRFWSGIFKK